MFQKLKPKKAIKIMVCLFIILVVGRHLSGVNFSNKNVNYTIDVNLILKALQQAKTDEIALENRYQLTAIISYWGHLPRLRRSIQYYVNSELFKEIIIWNNNPQANLTIKQIRIDNQLSHLIRIINSRKNLRDEGKYRACVEAQTLVCFYADDNWNISYYMKSLTASFRSDPNVLHSATDVVTYYNNMLWTFMDSTIDLHTGFSWVGTGSIFLREHAQRHLQLLEINLKTNRELFAFSDVFFPIWLNNIPSQMVVDLRPFHPSLDEHHRSFSPIDNFHNLERTSSVLAIRKLEYSLRLNRSTTNVTFSRQQNRQFPYCIKSPSSNDDFIFYSNILPIDIEHIPFDITQDASRATYQNVPAGPNYTHFESHSTLKVVDNDEKTCWHPLEMVRKDDFFAIDFLRIQTNIIFALIVAHSPELQNSLGLRVSFDGTWWIAHRSIKAVVSTFDGVFNASSYRLVVDSRQFSSELQSFRYITFQATEPFNEAFRICDVWIIKTF